MRLQQGIELRLGTRAVAIHANAREVELADGSRHHYGSLLLAAGAEPLRLALPGSVERANRTMQDRLVKELRLRGINTIATDNQLLPSFLADYNARFGKEPHNPKNLHRPLAAGDDLTDVFAWREERTVSNSLTLQYDKVVWTHSSL